jgi:hypothetical protein
VGEVDGTDVRVAIVATAHNARVYFCGGDASYMTLTRWFPLVPIDPAAGAVSQNTADGWSLQGHLDDAGVTGTIAVNGQGPWPFRMTPVAQGTIAGLYEKALPCGKAGVIVAQASSGEDPVGQGACIGTSGAKPSVEQVNPIRPITRASDGTIAVAVAGMMTTVQPAAAPAQ